MVRSIKYFWRLYRCLKQFGTDFEKIYRQIKKCFIQGLYFDRPVCMATMPYSRPISAVPTNKQLLGEKRMDAKFLNDIFKTEGVVRVYAVRETDLNDSVRTVGHS